MVSYGFSSGDNFSQNMTLKIGTSIKEAKWDPQIFGDWDG
jgi:hypothetical protein